MSKRYPGGLLSTTGVRKPSVTDQSQNSGVWTLEEQYQADANGTWANQGGSGYEIANSIRFTRGTSNNINRTLSASGNGRIATWSFWVKKCANGTGSSQFLVSTSNTSGADITTIGCVFDTSDKIFVVHHETYLTTAAAYRDTGAWMHIVLVADTTQTVPSDRTQLYVNGVRITAFSSSSYPSQNVANLNASGHWINIGGDVYGAGRIFDGYMTEVYYVDGQALTPSNFGYFDYNGIWQPKRYTGTYGVNGLYLPFNPTAYGDSISTTTLGLDKSGNGNNLTLTGFSTAAGITNDLFKDSPTTGSMTEDTGLGGQVSANYPVLNQLNRNNISLLDTSLRGYSGASVTGWGTSLATMAIPRTGKWYFEGTLSDLSASGGSYLAGLGIAPASTSLSFGTTFYLGETSSSYSVLVGLFSNAIKSSGPSTVIGGTVANNDVLMCAFDADTGRLWFGRNGTWYEGSPAAGTTPSYTIPTNIEWVFGVSSYFTSGFVGSITANFGQRPFAYAAPTGFRCINTASLPMSVVPNGRTSFNAVTYTGDHSYPRNISVGFVPDVVWIKDRTVGYHHRLFDTLRGTRDLFPNQTATEDAFNDGPEVLVNGHQDGFTIINNPNGTNTAGFGVNSVASSHISWNWKAGGAGVTNTSGTIATTVSVNRDAGFSVISYTGNGVEGATIGHGLNSIPKWCIIKSRTGAGDRSWPVFYFSTTQSAGSVFTSTTVNIGSKTGQVLSLNLNVGPGGYAMDGQTNANGASYIAYCWSEVEGYSKISSYIGNGSTDGSFVYTGFRPAYVLIKDVSGNSNSWIIMDNKRTSQFNPQDGWLVAQGFETEYNVNTSDSRIDLLSNGFKLRNANAGNNGSGRGYFYVAFAENPFKIARAR